MLTCRGPDILTSLKNEEEKTRSWGGGDMTGGWMEVGQKERLRREREEVKGK